MPAKRPLALRLAAKRQRAEQTPKPDPIARINTLVRAGKAAWFILLSYLAFVGVTLLGVEDADLFIRERETQLPLVGVSIPTLLFFTTAPALGAALFVYFQLQLLKLWEAIAQAKDEIRDARDRLAPWMVVDFALKRIPGGIPAARPLQGPIVVATGLMTFWAAPIVLGAFWYWSMPLHSEALTILGCGIPFMITLATALESGFYLNSLLGVQRRYALQRWRIVTSSLVVVVVVGWFTTEGSFERYAREWFGFDEPWYENSAGEWTNPAHDHWWGRSWLNDFLVPADLAGVDFVGLPETWRDFDTMQNTFRLDWCAAQSIPAPACGPSTPYTEMSAPQQTALMASRQSHCAGIFGAESGVATQTPADCEALFTYYDTSFRAAWELEWGAFLANLTPRDVSRFDLRNANLNGAQMQGAFLRRAQMQRADLGWAQMQGADLGGAQMQGADLGGAQMQGADLRRAQMQGADLRQAQMQGANLGQAQMQGAYLGFAQMQGAYLVFAQMQGADLGGAQMQGADLRLAQMQRADLGWAQMQGADLGGAQMQGADLGGAQMQGADLRRAQMQGADLGGAQMQGADLGQAQMSEDTDLTAATLRGAAVRSMDDTTTAQLRPFRDEIFADGTLTLPDGTARPAHWPEEELEYRDFTISLFHQEWRAFQDTLPDFPEDWKVQLPD